MFPKIFDILKRSKEPVPLNRISDALLDHHPEAASRSLNLEQEISKHLKTGQKFGLISGSDRGFKLTVDLDKREDGLFNSRLRVVQENLDAFGDGTPEEPSPGPSDAIIPTDRVRQRSRARTLDQVLRRPVQRQGSSNRKRATTQVEDRATMRASSQRGRSRSQAQSRSRTSSRTGSRAQSRTRSRSRSSRSRRH